MSIFSNQTKGPKKELPLVPLRELVVFPHMVVPFFAGRPSSIKAIEHAMNGDRMLFLACQKNNTEDPGREDLYEAGTVAKILQMLKLPDGTVRVLTEGVERGRIDRFYERKDAFFVLAEVIEEQRDPNAEVSALMGTVQGIFKRYAKLKKKISPEAIKAVEKAEYPDKLVDLVCQHAGFRIEQKVDFLALSDPKERLEELSVALEAENEILNLQDKINNRVRKKLENHQKEYFLNEQIKQINKELGRDGDDPTGVTELEAMLKKRKMPKEVWTKAQRELKRLGKLQPMSPESGVLRTYLEWMSDIPWVEKGHDNKDIEHAAEVLDEDHYALDKPKERILDFIAVRQLKDKIKGPILCLVGPPGTGKTSLARSVARALNRDFVRISLGGVRDEAEIRGHRKTYVGALPGKIIQAMKKVGTVNPVFLLDEIDKLNSDFRGDPASALLEVLDPEQNNTFVDHYLEVPYDLSNVMFITTANSLHSIPWALRDRMEIIEVPGYTEIEKYNIATRFIIPKQLKENGLDWADVTFQKAAISKIIQNYTMESGVRNLEREIGSIIRKIAREAVKEGLVIEEVLDDELEEEDNLLEDSDIEVEIADGLDNEDEAKAESFPTDDADISTEEATDEPSEEELRKQEILEKRESFSVSVTPKKVKEFLGKEKFENDLLYKKNVPGLSNGLAWTELGGTLLPVEVALFDGNGEFILTGNLGDVMKESARIAMSYLRSHADDFGIDCDDLKEKNIHIHAPEGAIPKDGPSAGITLTSAILSAVKQQPLAESFAMTGEITLTGRILAIGGLKEKVLAAHRNKIENVIVPKANKKDLDDIPKEVRNSITFHFVETAPEAIALLLPEDK